MKYLGILLFTASLMFCSCDGDDSIMNELAPMPIIEDINLVASLWQTLPVTTANYQLIVRNDETVDCENSALLISEFGSTGDEITLVIDGLEIDGPCIPGMVTLESTADLPPLGTYGLSVSNKREEVEVKVEMTEAYAAVKYEDLSPAGLRFTSDIQLKIPSEIAWGYTNLTATESDDIFEMINTVGPSAGPDFQILGLSSGDYGHFMIEMDPVQDIDKVMRIYDQTEFGQVGLVDLSEGSTWANLQEILEQTASKFSGFKYAFYNADGTILAN